MRRADDPQDSRVIIGNARFSVITTVLALSAIPSGAQEVGPGSETPDILDVAAVFGDACISTHPSFSEAGQILERYGLVMHPKDGTYYHPQTNLTVELVRNEFCSVVAATEGNLVHTTIVFRLAVAERVGHEQFDTLQIQTKPDGIPYLSASITAK